MLISNAYAQSAAPAAGGMDSGFLIMMVVMFAFMYLMVIRPQMKRQKEMKAMNEALQKGDEVVTAGGIVGKITNITDAYVTIEVASGTEILVQRQAVQMPLPKGTIKSQK